MAGFLDWPAFGGAAKRRPFEAGLPHALRVRRGVWGKVHGARSDFRWIARSAGLGEGTAAIEDLVWAGPEDQPACACFWRATASGWLAVSVRPSRAVDGAGRRDFCEKQVLEWTPGESTSALPAPAVALTLLPRVERFDDAIWWDRAPLLRDAPELVLPIPETESAPVTLDEAGIEASIARGLAELARAGDGGDLLPSLAAFYTAILDSAPAPASLRRLRGPLSGAALAALLLPLPRRVADRQSIAGWLFSSAVDLARLACNWDAVVLPPTCRAGDAKPVQASPAGVRLAEAVLGGRPPVALAPRSRVPSPPPSIQEQPQRRAAVAMPGRPGESLPLRAPSASAPAVVHAIFEFARAADRRWLAAETLDGVYRAAPHPAAVSAADGALVLEWIEQVAAGRPPAAHPEQWSVKVDLLRAAGLALMPTTETLRRIGTLESGLVPPLHFAPVLVAGPGMLRERLGTDAFAACVRASRACDSYRLRRAVERWLGDDVLEVLGR